MAQDHDVDANLFLKNRRKIARIVAIRAESMFKLYSHATSSIDAAILPLLH
jgi:hypothetical protein